MKRRSFLKFATCGLAGLAAREQAAASESHTSARMSRIAGRNQRHLEELEKHFTTLGASAPIEKAAFPPSLVGNFAKGLPHNDSGEVLPSAWGILRNACMGGDYALMETVPLGGRRKLASPLSGHALSLEAGCDPQALFCPAPPAMGSARLAAELTELYWMAKCRDLAFDDYQQAELTAQAWAELQPLIAEHDSSHGVQALFRGITHQDHVGPYISQFLLLDFITGSLIVPQRYRVCVSVHDYLLDYDDWLRNVRGFAPTQPPVFSKKPRHLRTGRDLGECVHRDFSSQLLLQAALILLGGNYSQKARRFPFAPSNPYPSSLTQDAFCTYGEPEIMDLVSRACTLALRACWYQKWNQFLYLRPEECAGRLEAWRRMRKSDPCPLHTSILDHSASRHMLSDNGSFLLAQAYPEASPIHPSYPSGHAVLAGAGVTVLKACFDENAIFPRPIRVEGDDLAPLQAELTVGNELDKLAANIAVGRNIAGIHWRCDAREGLRLGERAAVSILRCLKETRAEAGGNIRFTSFDGDLVEI